MEFRTFPSLVVIWSLTYTDSRCLWNRNQIKNPENLCKFAHQSDFSISGSDISGDFLFCPWLFRADETFPCQISLLCVFSYLPTFETKPFSSPTIPFCQSCSNQSQFWFFSCSFTWKKLIFDLNADPSGNLCIEPHEASFQPVFCSTPIWSLA